MAVGGVGVTEGVKFLRFRTALFGESQSWCTIRLRALRELNALQALTVYQVFEDEKSNRSEKKWSSAILHKADHSTNTIATNIA